MLASIIYDKNGVMFPYMNRYREVSNREEAKLFYREQVNRDYERGNLNRVFGDNCKVRCYLYIGNNSRPVLTNTANLRSHI